MSTPMPETLFDLDEKPPPFALRLEGFMLAHDLTEPLRRVGQVIEPHWYLEPESFSESREGVEDYQAVWGDAKSRIVKVTIVAVEP